MKCSMKDRKFLSVVVAAVVVIAGMVFVLSADDDTSSDDAHYIEFFFYDNHINDIYVTDNPASGLAKNKNIANGVWVKGYGETKIDCFKDACGSYGIQVTVSEDGTITSLNGITDGNFHQMGWIYNGWSATITLTSDETYPIRFMAIGHGAGSATGNPPVPWQGPDDIRWYYGESAEKGNGTAVLFYFYDSYENDPTSASSSDLSKFVAEGYWVAGYGDLVHEAFKDACARLGKYLGYNDLTGEIFRIGDVNSDIHSLNWNGTSWIKCNISSVPLTSDTYIAVGHGPTTYTGIPPAPWETPDDIVWSL